MAGGVHERRNVSCASCHSVHSPRSPRAQLKLASQSETCFTCHQAIRAKTMRSSHHPVREGRIECGSCHDPHDGSRQHLVSADSVNEKCLSCHTEKRGPFLWEHAPVQESCLNCHDPHGSNHEKLLVTSLPLLCQECHSPIDLPNVAHPGALTTAQNAPNAGVPDDRLVNRGCLNCHSQIHGSNHPSGPRFHR